MAGDPYPKSAQLGAQRKKYRRKVASRKTWEKLRDERLGPCLIGRYLGVECAKHVELHHVVRRGAPHFGDDVADNLVPLCRAHHRKVTDGHSVVLQALAAAIQAWEPAVYAYAIDKLGEDGFLRLHKVAFGCVVDESAGLAS